MIFQLLEMLCGTDEGVGTMAPKWHLLMTKPHMFMAPHMLMAPLVNITVYLDAPTNYVNGTPPYYSPYTC